LGLPTKFGQHMRIKPSRGSDLVWVSKDSKGEVWFDAQISLLDFKAVKTSDEEKAAYIGKVLKNAVRLNSEFLDKWNGFKVETELEFEKDWGLGSSSSLIYCIAKWAEVNPFYLHFKISNGSGYDIACAFSEGPIEYRITDEELSYGEVDFDPKFKDKLFFIYLGKKADSKLEVEQYFKNGKPKKEDIANITNLTDKIITSKSFGKFEQYLQSHEEILAKVLKRKPVKEEHFKDYWGSIKSLGGWGGDFILATSDKTVKQTTSYFKEKGFDTILPYRELIL